MNPKHIGRQLYLDSAGAILLLGIALGAALAAALFYLVSIGEGILWREAAQNAADAAAFENAVWHARGMNMIASLNIVLSLLSAIIVMWRLTILALGFATLADLVTSMQLPDAERESASLPLSSLVQMLAADDRVAETISSAAAGIAAAQVAVATYTPLLAMQVRSPELNLRGGAVDTATFSGSLLPAAEGRPTRDTATRGDDLNQATARAQNASPSVSGRLGIPFSLPVQAGSQSLSCPPFPAGFAQRSTMLVQTLPREWRNRLLSPSGPREEKAFAQFGLDSHGEGVFALMQSLYGLAEAPALLCSRPSPPMDYLKQLLWRIAAHANDASSVKDTSLSDSIRNHLHASVTPLTSVREANALFQQWQGAFHFDATAYRFGTPAEIWHRAQNGNVYLRSTAVVSAAPASLGLTPFPDMNASRQNAARIWAHAETYFDCAKAWHECKSDALWRPEWRARLRRVQPYALLLRQAGASPVEPAHLEATVTHWLERSARPLGRSVRAPKLEGFLPEFESIQVRDTPTVRARAVARGRAPDDTLLDEFLNRQGTSNGVVH